MSDFAKASEELSSKGAMALLSRVKIAILRRAHEQLWDRRFYQYEAVKTGGNLESHDLDPIDATHHSEKVDYIPTPRLVLNWLLDELDIDFSDYSFVDLGSGRGRVLVAAAEKPFARLEGVEFSKVLHREAQQILEAYPKKLINSGPMRSVCMDAGKYKFPSGNCVLFLFNPFEPDLLSQVINNAVEQANAQKATLKIIYFNPFFDEVLAQHPGLRETQMSWSTRMKLRLFSPFSAKIYSFG